MPSQNFVYADVDGHIGYYAPGHIPVRASGNGAKPAPEWRELESGTVVSYDDLPHVFDPPQHFIVTADHRPMPPDYPYLIATEYPDPYRAERITQLLTNRTKLAPDDFRDIQADALSLHAQRLLPLLLAHARTDVPAEQAALDLLRKWNFVGSGDSSAEAIFQAWFAQLMPAIAGDELGPRAGASHQGRF